MHAATHAATRKFPYKEQTRGSLRCAAAHVVRDERVARVSANACRLGHRQRRVCRRAAAAHVGALQGTRIEARAAMNESRDRFFAFELVFARRRACERRRDQRSDDEGGSVSCAPRVHRCVDDTRAWPRAKRRIFMQRQARWREVGRRCVVAASRCCRAAHAEDRELGIPHAALRRHDLGARVDEPPMCSPSSNALFDAVDGEHRVEPAPRPRR
jgi:hypothetical protein